MAATSDGSVSGGEQHLLDVRRAAQGVRVVGIEVRGVERARRGSAEAGPLAGLAGGERQAADRAAVEGAEEGDGVGPAGVVAGQLEGGLDGLGAGVAEEHAGVGHRGQRGEPLADLGVGREVEVARAVVQDVVDLGVDGRVDGRVAVAGGGDGDAGVEVEEAVAVDVLDDAAPRPPHDERVDAGERGAGDGFVPRDDLPGHGPGQLGAQVRRRRVRGEVGQLSDGLGDRHDVSFLRSKSSPRL